MGLKSHLEEKIKKEGFLSYKDLCSLSQVWSFKVSTAERRLRQSPNIEPVFKEKDLFNKKAYIIGYRYKQAQQTLPLAGSPFSSKVNINERPTSNRGLNEKRAYIEAAGLGG